MINTIKIPPAESIEDVTITAEIIREVESLFHHECPQEFDITVYVDGVQLGEVAFISRKYYEPMSIPAWRLQISEEVREWMDSSTVMNKVVIDQIWGAALSALKDKHD